MKYIYVIIFAAGMVMFSGCHSNTPGVTPAATADTASRQLQSSTLDSANIPVTPSVVGLEVGKIAPELELKNPKGQNVKLSSLHGKIVLVDFWASWCMPCRMENPNVVKVYNKYRNSHFREGEGFTIYSVSLDTNEKRWLEAISHDGLAWDTHVSDLKGWDSRAVTEYSIESIPSSFLINGQGIIIARDLRADALETTIRSLIK